MSLNWDLTKIRDSESLYVEATKDAKGKQLYRLNDTTELIIWTTIAVKLGSIRADNLEEWAFRLAVLEQIGNQMGTRMVEGKPVGYNPSMVDIERHLGLSTSTSTLTRAEFMKDIKRQLTESAQREVTAYRESKHAAVAV